jgi:hypothetical protein
VLRHELALATAKCTGVRGRPTAVRELALQDHELAARAALIASHERALAR